MSQPRTVLITGAAGGIGAATVRRFLEAGWRVGAYDVTTAGLEQLSEHAGGHTGDPELLVTGALDVTDPEQWARALAELTGRSGGRLDVLVNNAGILVGGRFAELPLDQQRRQVEVNVLGAVNGCHTAYPYLRDTPGARVINLASASAIYGQAELATYSATKFAVRGLTEALDLEWAEDDISLSAVWPLFVATGMTAHLDIGSTRSLGIRLSAEDVADVVYDEATRRRGPLGVLGSVHRAVGRPAIAMLTSSQLAPSSVLRVINRRIGGGGWLR